MNNHLLSRKISLDYLRASATTLITE